MTQPVRRRSANAVEWIVLTVGTICGWTAVMANAHTGPVCDENVLSLAIIDPEPCYKEGDQVCVALAMSELRQFVTGFQAFLAYDDSLLTFLPGASSYTAAPFSQHIQAMGSAEVSPGEINLDGSDVISGPGTDQDALLATLCFSVDSGNNGATFGFDFRAFGPFVSELSFQGNPLPTCLIESGTAEVDQSPPDLTCPPDSTVVCSEIPPPDFAGGSVSDDCDPSPAVVHEGDVISGGCPRTLLRTYRATDSAGNSDSCTQTIMLTCENLLALALIDPEPCYKEGDQVCVALEMSELQQFVTGFQAFLAYDDDLLTFLPGASSYTAAPFSQHIQAMGSAEVSPGEINLDGSDVIFGPGTDQDALLATLCFSVDAGNDGATFGFDFRAFGPFVSELSFQGSPLPTCLIESGTAEVDQTPPELTCPPDSSAVCSEIPPPDFAGGSVSDNCDPSPAVVHEADVISGGCPRTLQRTYRATDSAGNSTTCTQTITLTCENVLSLAIIDPEPCYKEGDQVCLSLEMSELQQFVTGFQAFLAYDDGLLTFLPGASSYTAAPFSQHIQAMGSAEVSPGEINLDGSDVISGPGTDQDAPLATLCFSVDAGNDGAIFGFDFRAFGPFVSELSYHGSPLPTCLIESGLGEIDQECPPPPAAISGAVLRKTHAVVGEDDIAVNVAGHVENGNVTSESRACKITQLRLTFDQPPDGPGASPVTIQEQGVPGTSQASYGPYSGGSTVSASIVGNELILIFTPGLENKHTYKLTLGPEISSIPGQSVEVRALHCDTSSDGHVNATDRSVVVGAWTLPGTGYSPATDVNLDGSSNSLDVSFVVGVWTGGTYCP